MVKVVVDDGSPLLTPVCANKVGMLAVGSTTAGTPTITP